MVISDKEERERAGNMAITEKGRHKKSKAVLFMNKINIFND